MRRLQLPCIGWPHHLRHLRRASVWCVVLCVEACDGASGGSAQPLMDAGGTSATGNSYTDYGSNTSSTGDSNSNSGGSNSYSGGSTDMQGSGSNSSVGSGSIDAGGTHSNQGGLGDLLGGLGGSADAGAAAGDAGMCANLICWDVLDCYIYHADKAGPCKFTACTNFACK